MFGSVPRSFCTTDPPKLACVLQALFELSMGARDQITVLGAGECAFVAAISEWLFSLKTHVEDDYGNILFTSSNDAQAAQVHVKYTDSVPEANVVVSQSTFILRQASQLFA